MKSLLVLLLLFLVAGLAKAQWRHIAPEEAYVRAIAEDNGKFYIATQPGGIYTSYDKMGSWHPMGWGLPTTNLHTLVALKDGTVIVGTSSGMFSLDSDGKWKQYQPEVFGTSYINIIERMSEDVYLVGGGKGHLLRSGDGGETWQMMDSIPGRNMVTDFQVVESGNWLLASKDLYSSTDEGETWSLVEPYREMGGSATKIASKGTAVYTIGNGIRYSPDKGKKWTHALGSKSQSITYNKAFIYTAGTNGVSHIYLSFYRNGYIDFTVASQWVMPFLRNGEHHQLFASSEDSLYVYGEAGIHVLKVLGEGTSEVDSILQPRNRGLYHGNLPEVFGTSNGGVYSTVSREGEFLLDPGVNGAIPRRLSDKPTAVKELSRASSGRLCAIRGGYNSEVLSISDTDGDNWISLSLHELDNDWNDRRGAIHSFASIHPTDSSQIAAKVQGELVLVTVLDSSSPRYSFDVIEGVEQIGGIAHNGDYLMLATPDGVLKYEIDLFETLSTVLKDIDVEQIHRVEDGVFIALSDSLMYITEDDGNSWSNISTPVTNDEFRVESRDREHFAVYGRNSVYETTNGGVSWDSLGGLPVGRVNSIEYTDHYLCVSIYMQGAWVKRIGEVTSVEEQEFNIVPSSVHVRPNPASDYITFSVDTDSSELCHLRVVNTLGETLLESSVDTSYQEAGLRVSSLPSGLYSLLIESSGIVRSAQFVVAR